jgi:glycine hydroxymethyltransferase
LTTRGFGAAEFDTVAELIVEVLRNTQSLAAKDGSPSKVKYATSDGVADKTKSAAAELLDNYPLYPGLTL